MEEAEKVVYVLIIVAAGCNIQISSVCLFVSTVRWQQMKVNDETVPCSFKLLIGSEDAEFFWLCADQTTVKDEWVRN